MNSNKLKNTPDEHENFSADEQKISELVGRLEQVSAPKDFEFRLKARIAAAQETNHQPSIWKTLRYALPLTATAIIAAFMLFQAGLFSSKPSPKEAIIVSANTNQQPIITNQVPTVNTEVALTTNSDSEETDTAIKQPNSNIAGSISKERNNKPADKQKNSRSNSSDKDNFKGTDLLASRPPDINITPNGMSKDKAVSMQEIFNIIGIETEDDGNKLKIKSVKENSLAERSGVKSGDLLEAIDGQKIDGSNSLPKLNGAKNITVIREKKVQTIELKP